MAGYKVTPAKVAVTVVVVALLMKAAADAKLKGTTMFNVEGHKL